MKPTPTPTKAKAVLRSKVRTYTGTPPRAKSHQEIRKEAPHIELFQKEGCSHSHAVRNYLSALGIDYIARSVAERQDLKHHQLVLAGGKDQIPFLMDHQSGVKLYGSDTIISYLEKEYGKPASGRAMRVLQLAERRMRSQAERLQWTLKMPVERIHTFSLEMNDLFSNTTDILKNTFKEMKEAIRPETDRTSDSSNQMSA
jgi:glutathione S-transferase